MGTPHSSFSDSIFIRMCAQHDSLSLLMHDVTDELFYYFHFFSYHSKFVVLLDVGSINVHGSIFVQTAGAAVAAALC